MSLPKEILNLDLAALRTFRLVYQKASFAAAAVELGMNASSISYTIDRVRKAAGDPLFLRQGGGIAPTDQCQSLLGHVERILAEAEHISGDRTFDPAKAEAEITVLSAAYANQVIWPLIIRRLRREAPGVKLAFLSGYQDLPELLLQGKVDIAFTVGTINVNGIRVQESQLTDQHVCLMDPAHPMAAKKVLSVEDFVSAGHVRFEPFSGWLQAPIRYAVEHGLAPERVIASDVATDIPHLVEGTDLFASLPGRLAWQWRDCLAVRPFDFPTPIWNSIFWSETTHRSPLKRWLRELLFEEAKNLPQPKF